MWGGESSGKDDRYRPVEKTTTKRKSNGTLIRRKMREEQI